ncbi:MAG: ATP-dependent acyl-CoA ligase [Alphaproteobacteria bacterium]|nr:ATP-dependent acyl-CoA ligase [Alphaproteobacteria bacterium]
MRASHPAADSVVALCRRAAGLWPAKNALVFDETGERLTFDEIDKRSDRIAAALAALGIAPGDRVALMVRNVPAFPLVWLGILKAGAIMVPVNVFYRVADAGHVLSHSGARAVVAADEFVPLLSRVVAEGGLSVVIVSGDGTGDGAVQSLDALVAAAPEDTPAVPVRSDMLANIQYTSGTTGQPKGVMQSHGMWVDFCRRVAELHDGLSADDVILTAQPFYYLDPQWNLAVAFLTGAELIVLDRFHPSTFWDRVRAYRVTWFYCLGVMPKLLLKQPVDPRDRDHAVRRVLCSAIPPVDHAAIEARWGTPWFEAFGMTETGIDIAVPLDEHDACVGTGCIGRPVAGREARVVDEDGRPVPPDVVGELVLRGTGMMDGYYRNPEATAETFRGGWMHTGDLARRDNDGRIFFVGRDKDMIRRSGENIAAAEIETVLAQHDAVRLAACLGVPDDLRGEEVMAFVVLQPGHSAETLPPPDLAAFCDDRLAYFKVPRYWAYRDDLPRTPSERVRKEALKGERGDPRVGAWDRLEERWR